MSKNQGWGNQGRVRAATKPHKELEKNFVLTNDYITQSHLCVRTARRGALTGVCDSWDFKE